MNPTMRDTAFDTLKYLITLHREGVRPPDAQARLLDLQARHPDTKMQLVWEEEPYDASVHYDVLLRLHEGITLSLSACPDRALPWPLRGVHRWSDADLVRVNGFTIAMQEAIALLDVLWTDASLMDRLVNTIVIREELIRDPIKLADAELQAGIDGFRRAHRLYGAEDTRVWMQARGMTHADLERHVSDALVTARLRERLADGRVEAYFQDHRADFDAVHFAQIVCHDRARADQIHRDVTAGELSFLEAAQRHFLSWTARPGEKQRALFATLRRRDAPPELALALFAAAPGDVVGPIATTDGGYAVAQLLSHDPARLDEATTASIEEILWDAWLAERRQAARIEWFWGQSRAA